MELSGITPEAVAAQRQAMVQEQIQVSVFRQALDAQASAAMQLVRMMDQAVGLGRGIDVRG